MEPAVRGARIEPTIIATRLETALFASQDSKFPNHQTAFCRSKPCRRERIFWTQRPEAKNPPERPVMSAETGNSKIGVKNPRRNGLFLIGDGFRSSGRLDGGDHLDQTACSPRSHRNQSPILEPGTELFAAETGRRNGLIRLDCRSRDRANQRICCRGRFSFSLYTGQDKRTGEASPSGRDPALLVMPNRPKF